MELLTDHENYVELESNQDRTIMKNINCLIKKYQNELTKKGIGLHSKFYVQNIKFLWPTQDSQINQYYNSHQRTKRGLHKTTTTSRP